MKKIALLVLILGLMCLGAPATSQAQVAVTGFSISLLDNSQVDAASAGFYGKSTWYQWLYRIDVIGDPQGLSHVTLELQDCFSPELLKIMASTAGYNNLGNLYGETVDETRTYEVEFGTDGSTSTYGLKWNSDPMMGDTDEQLDEDGEYDLFWFSAPTMEEYAGGGVFKYGQAVDEFRVATPDCPDCKPPVVPEPSSMLLLGSGMFAAVMRKKFKA